MRTTHPVEFEGRWRDRERGELGTRAGVLLLLIGLRFVGGFLHLNPRGLAPTCEEVVPGGLL